MTGTTNGLSVHVKGEVMRSEAETLAVKFTVIDADSLFHLQNIIRYNEPDYEAAEEEIRDHPGMV